MLDRDLAALYGVETKRLKEQVKRNIERFPEDFMFKLSKKEYENLRSQIATSSWGGTRYAPILRKNKLNTSKGNRITIARRAWWFA